MEKFEIFTDPSLSALRNNELNSYRKSGKFADVTLQTVDKQQTKVHKNVLSASCKYFRAMFNSDYMESRQNIIKLSDEITMNDLEIIIEYLYTGQVKILTKNAMSIFVQAQFFNLIELQNFCSKMLAQSLQIHNALDLWRFSDKYKDDSLRNACLNLCTLYAKEFFKISLFQLTYNELKTVISSDVLPISQEHLYTVLMDWCKHDFSAREQYLEEFLATIDFSQISNEFIESIILSNSVLYDNRNFSIKMTKLTFSRLNNTQKKDQLMKEKETLTPTKKNKTILNLITATGIFELNWELKKWVKLLSFKNERDCGFSTSTFHADIFIAGGYENGNKFESYQRSLRKMSDSQRMLENRYYHRTMQFDGKIYCCGGKNNCGSTEMFDPEQSKWIARSKKEPTYSFGITSVGNSIYTLGGMVNTLQNTAIVEHYDPRIDKWTIISNDKEELEKNPVLSAAVNLNDTIYCFSGLTERSTFDIRTKKWNRFTSGAMKSNKNINYKLNSFDITECNGEVYGIFPTRCQNVWDTFKYDHKENCWIYLEIPFESNVNLYYIRLCSIDV